VTLEVAQVVAEARHLKAQGFRSLLLVAGEHPKFVSHGYLGKCIAAVAAEVPSVALEVAPLETDEYRRMVGAGAEALVVYQETYDPENYAQIHRAGPKKDYAWRLGCPERGYDAGFRRIGIGALFGLCPWRSEAIALARHLEYLLKRCWKAQFTVALPRLRPCAGEFEPLHPMGDRDFTQLQCAFRLCFPQVGIVMSTREPARLRDALVPLGVTMMSAGSHTEPGGYTGQGKEALHHTVGGRQVALGEDRQGEGATEQFAIADERSPAEVAAALQRGGLEAVWKDWDPAIMGGGLL
jgi:2-iminoacetate synthase